MDRGAGQRTELDVVDELKHLAKVGVAGSNPVFRSIPSIVAAQRQFLTFQVDGRGGRRPRLPVEQAWPSVVTSPELWVRNQSPHVLVEERHGKSDFSVARRITERFFQQ